MMSRSEESDVSLVFKWPHQMWRQKDFLSLGAIKLLMKAERDGGIPVFVRPLESVVFVKEICFRNKENKKKILTLREIEE